MCGGEAQAGKLGRPRVTRWEERNASAPRRRNHGSVARGTRVWVGARCLASDVIHEAGSSVSVIRGRSTESQLGDGAGLAVALSLYPVFRSNSPRLSPISCPAPSLLTNILRPSARFAQKPWKYRPSSTPEPIIIPLADPIQPEFHMVLPRKEVVHEPINFLKEDYPQPSGFTEHHRLCQSQSPGIDRSFTASETRGPSERTNDSMSLIRPIRMRGAGDRGGHPPITLGHASNPRFASRTDSLRPKTEKSECFFLSKTGPSPIPAGLGLFPKGSLGGWNAGEGDEGAQAMRVPRALRNPPPYFSLEGHEPDWLIPLLPDWDIHMQSA
ncbi:hypothetical protein BDK51DRAFT_37753 [Blyttiomyces helicus]|uniref:Uncharacterized protein n=1 Tax=Blyttiomyces helicus TaxID=388810 RepID=A0A4V1IS27_9FUNG|nr:hypothetical protein BDK51DRAFT_37753 [Blyttiomyces helicus]|eukprot:RKO92097.1 hypothetical protein BDK51DRAFT_37753 [Blyttiomyces helicus]